MNVPILRPRSCPVGIDPADWRRAVAARLEQLADTMAALITALDQMDGDADYEFIGDELDITAPEGWRPFDISLLDDSEEDDVREDDGIAEPTLGAPETLVLPSSWALSVHRTHEGDQSHWADGSKRVRQDDAEDENEHGGNISDELHRVVSA